LPPSSNDRFVHRRGIVSNIPPPIHWRGEGAGTRGIHREANQLHCAGPDIGDETITVDREGVFKLIGTKSPRLEDGQEGEADPRGLRPPRYKRLAYTAVWASEVLDARSCRLR
jgi:hypothetical protein